MRMTKKITSIVLAVMMVVSMMSVMAVTANAAVGDYVAEKDYLTFTALEDDSSVMLSNVRSGSNFKYNKNGTGWHDYNPDDYDRIELNKGEYVRFRGSDTVSNSSRGCFSINRKVAASGNIMSLRLDSDSRSQGLTDECFINLFSGCEGLITAPELPETTLAKECYDAMFEGCKNLTTAPALPATTLAYGCYADMFMGCKSLTEAPELPATSLATYCYGGMFDGCTSLTELPALPATTLANYCYSHMFSGCSNIRISDEAGTINGIKYSEAYRIPSEGTATNASYALDSMFYATGGKFKATPSINTTYYIGKPVYTVKWKNGDNVIEEDKDVESGATPTFNGTTPEKASDTYYDYTFSGWSDGTNTYAADALPAVSGDVTYTAQFTATAKTFKVIVMKLTGGTYNIENLTGETTVAQLKEIIADQIDIPATAQRLIFAGKDIEDAKTLAEYNIQKESKIHVVAKTYTVTWLNYDNSELGTANVAYGSTPTYDGTPERPEDANNTYTFSGWSPEVTAVTGDATYTAQYTATPKHTVHTYTANPTFNWTQDASTGDWDCDTLTLTCTGCDLTQDTNVAGVLGATNVKCTADANGDFTYKISKKISGVTYEDTKTLDANGVVKSVTQLKAAAAKGGSWELGNDIDRVINVKCANGFVLDGKNYTVTRPDGNSNYPVFVAADKNAGFTLKNLTIDGVANTINGRPAIASAQSGVNTGNVINLNNVTITNWDFDADNNGAVLAWGYATVNMDNCNIDTDSTYDVWVGSKGTVDIAGGDTGNVYLHSYSGTGAVLNAAGGANIDKITLDTTVTSTLKADIGRATVGAIEANGDIPSEVVVIDPSVSSVNAPDGYEWAFSEEEGRKTLAPIDPENPLQGKAQIIGYQRKIVNTEQSVNETGNNINTKGVRIVTKVDNDFLSTCDDYGYVVAKVTDGPKTFEQSNTNFAAMIKDGGNGEKTISCKNTHNEGVGYGDGYVTLAVNGMTDGQKAVARFYVVLNGKTYYANYSTYTGILAEYTEVLNG